MNRMRSRVFLYGTTALLAVLLVAPYVTHAQIPFFGPVIPPDVQRCAAGWGAALVVVNRVIRLLLTIAIVFVAPLTIAYAGFLFVVNPTSAGDIEKAKKILANTVVGISIALASWLIVDAVMAVFYKQDGETLTQAWWQIVGSGGAERCLPIAATQRPSDRTAVSTTTIPYPPPTGDGACDPEVLKGIIPSLTDQQANTFACIARYESNCGTIMKNYSWNKPNSKGIASSAYGAFQVTLSSNHAAFENQTCYAAAGVSPTLSCNLAFSNGFTKDDEVSLGILENCLKAASNLSCNFTAAYYVYQRQGFKAWTADVHAKSQQQCINQYAS